MWASFSVCQRMAKVYQRIVMRADEYSLLKPMIYSETMLGLVAWLFSGFVLSAKPRIYRYLTLKRAEN